MVPPWQLRSGEEREFEQDHVPSSQPTLREKHKVGQEIEHDAVTLTGWSKKPFWGGGWHSNDIWVMGESGWAPYRSEERVWKAHGTVVAKGLRATNLLVGRSVTAGPLGKEVGAGLAQLLQGSQGSLWLEWGPCVCACGLRPWGTLMLAV